jgi:hypothetical protein
MTAEVTARLAAGKARAKDDRALRVAEWSEWSTLHARGKAALRDMPDITGLGKTDWQHAAALGLVDARHLAPTDYDDE